MRKGLSVSSHISLFLKNSTILADSLINSIICDDSLICETLLFLHGNIVLSARNGLSASLQISPFLKNSLFLADNAIY